MKPDRTTDKLLVLSYQAGNGKALSLLVKRWHYRLCRQAYWYTKDLDQANDIAQDTWQTVIEKINDLREADRFGSWVMTIVTRKAIDHSKKKRQGVSISSLEIKAENPENDEMQQQPEGIRGHLKKSIEQLSEEQQLVLTLFYTQEYSLKEISTILQVPLATVKTRLFRAREKLKKLLKDNKDEKRS